MLKSFAAALLLGSGVSVLGVTIPDERLLVWIGGVASISGAFLWMGRMVWKAGADRQHAIDKICQQAERLTRLAALLEQATSDLSVELDKQGEKLDEVSATVARIDATCSERAKLYETLMQRGASAGKLVDTSGRRKK